MNKMIIKMIFGSHLYGTNTPDSDWDYKGIFMPSRRDIYLGRIPKSIRRDTKKGNTSRNTSNDVDEEIYSLHYFIKLACEGQTVAIDMLHAPPSMIWEHHPLWKELVTNRSRFYTRNLKAFVGYARKQAAKYGIRGSRLHAIGQVISFLKKCPENCRLADVWDDLPTGEHIHFLPPDSKTEQPLYQVCGKKFMVRTHIRNVLESLQRSYDAYGHRAQQAKENKGIDWKAVSHAIRAAIQMQEIYTKGNIYFPLAQADLLRRIKAGKMDYTTYVAPLLENLIDNVEQLAKQSNLPDKVDRKWWDEWLISAIERYAE